MSVRGTRYENLCTFTIWVIIDKEQKNLILRFESGAVLGLHSIACNVHEMCLFDMKKEIRVCYRGTDNKMCAYTIQMEINK